MLKCRVLFIEVLVLAALVLYLLFVLYGRHETITTVASGMGLRGGYAKTGDKIAFRTLYPGDHGYTVTFDAPYPCQNSAGVDIKTLTVIGGQTTSCTVTATSGQEGSGVVFSYTITPGTGSVDDPSKRKVPPGRGKDGESYDSANPCRLCSPVIGGGDGDGNSASGSDVKVKELTSSSDVYRKITCNGSTATVSPVTVVQGNNLDWWAANNWSAYNFVPVPPSGSTACSNDTTFSSTGTYAYCQAKDPSTYSYSVHLDGCANDGINTGSLTVQAPPTPVQAPK